MLVYAVGRSEVPPFPMSERFRHEVTFFMTVPGDPGVPKLGTNEYWIKLDQARHWLDEGSVRVVSPLDSENQTEIELSEEHEAWLEWMVEHGTERIRLA